MDGLNWRRYVSLVDGKNLGGDKQIEMRTKGRGKGVGTERKQSSAIRRYATKKTKYKFYQQLFNKDRRLARVIMGEPDKVNCEIPMDEIEKYFIDILGNAGHGNIVGWPSSMERADNDILMSPISVDEVRTVLREIKKDSAPGPDKIKVSDLRDIFNLDSLIITKIFNMWFLNGHRMRRN